MSADASLAEVEIRGGTRLTLFANRLVLAGADATEIVPLAHLASVRVGFARDARKLNWAIALLALALAFALLSAPLQAWMLDLASKVEASAGRESLEAVLVAVFGALARFARLLLPIALLLAAGAAALLILFRLGSTTLTLAFAATERACAVRGRNPQLADFAHLLGERLAERRD